MAILTKSELLELFNFIIKTLVKLDKHFNITFQELKEFSETLDNIEDFQEDGNYISYKDYIRDLIEYQIMYY